MKCKKITKDLKEKPNSTGCAVTHKSLEKCFEHFNHCCLKA